MSHFAANKVIVLGGTGGPNSLEKTLFGTPEQVSRGEFIRKSVSEASGTGGGVTKPNILCENCAFVFGENGDWGGSQPHSKTGLGLVEGDEDDPLGGQARDLAQLGGESHQYPSRDHYNFPGLIESAENGCHLCVLLLNHIPLERWEQLQRRLNEGLEQSTLNLKVRRQEFINDRSVELKYYVELGGFQLEDEESVPYSSGKQALLGTYSTTLVLEPQIPDGKSLTKPK